MPFFHLIIRLKITIYIYIASNDDELIRTYNLYMYLKIVLNVNIRLHVNIMIII